MADPTVQAGDALPPSAPVVRVPIDSIFPDPANVRLHDERNLATVMASLQRFGQRTPLTIDADRIIRKGNGTHEAARRLGWTHIDVAPWEARGSEATAYAITDNRSSELAQWDLQPLSEQLAALQQEHYPLDELGWSREDLGPLLGADWDPNSAEGGEGPAASLSAPIHVTADQRITINRAIRTMRAIDGEDLTEGRCVELMAADWLAGAPNLLPDDDRGGT
jgi:hypothetical protein